MTSFFLLSISGHDHIFTCLRLASMVVRSISYMSIKKVKELNLKSHTFLELRKSVSIATISFRGLSMTLFAALQVQGVLCVRVNCRGHHLILFYS